MDKPVVLVVSADASVKPEDVIGRVRKAPATEGTVVLADGLAGHCYHIRTKYYETDVVFCGWPGGKELAEVPEAILKQMEGVLIYFDARDRDFLKRLPEYAAFVTEADIEFGILLCAELQEEADQGITYREAKKFCNVLDVIELDPTGGGETVGEEDDGEAAGVDELVQALHNFIWSNVDMHRKAGGAGGGGGAEAGKEDETTDGAGEEDPEDERRIEEELMGFEKLLTQVMQFRPNTSSWTRNERLAYAQEFAEFFDELIGEED
uniref:Alpha- and gamma-adaptin-binding protein p34 n=2 Tax=Culex pipiens TaxID=7175 RepID=A0A8D8I1J6_CULPI